MKITFIYSDNCVGNENKFNLGIAALSAYLKREGFNTSLIHIFKDITQTELLTAIDKHNPDILAFSYMSINFQEIKRFIEWTKHLPTPKIHGGTHPSMAPEETLSVDGVDVICIGEGEQALTEFCHAISNGTSFQNIPSLWVKKVDGSIKKNPVRPLIEDLNTLPFLDYDIFDYLHIRDVTELGRLMVQASRGCFFRCAYCGNNYLRNLYPNKNKYLRSVSVDWLIDEIEYGLKKFPSLTAIRFIDDTLTNNKKWFEEFVKKYKKRINLPFSGNDRVENLSQEVVDMLKDAGCTYLDIGIENGDPIFRRQIMNRYMEDETIINAFCRLRKAGIFTRAFNIFGMVNETKQITLQTIKLNAKARPDCFIKAYFIPLIGTQAAKMAKERNLKVKRAATSFFEKPQVELTTMESCETEFFYKHLSFLVNLYSLIYLTKKKSIENFTDHILLSNYFPYRFFNKIYFINKFLHDLIYRSKINVLLRKPYHFLKFKLSHYLDKAIVSK